MEDFHIPMNITASKGHSRTIVHIDIDCFYAQVEMIRNPELRDKPLGIQQKNIVVTCNYVAREFGVRKLMFISDAKKCCPDLILVSGEDLTNYRSFSSKVTELLQSRFTQTIEKLGFDENFIDVSLVVAERKHANTLVGNVYGNSDSKSCTCGCFERLTIGSQIAAEMRQAIFEDLGLTTCAGISYNKLLAKLAGEIHKPNQQTTLFPGQALELINSLSSIRNIPGIGRQTAKILESKLSVKSIPSLQNCSLSELQKALGSQGQAKIIQKLGFGIDDTDVKISGLPQSIGLEDAFKGIYTMEEAEKKLNALLQHLLELLYNQNPHRTPGTIRISVRKYNKILQESNRESRQCSIPPLHPKNDMNKNNEKLTPIIVDLFKKIINPTEKFHLTLLGLAFTNFSELKTGKASILTFMEPSCKKIKPNEETKHHTVEASTSTNLPPNVDAKVFAELPPDVQKDILDEWEQQKSFQVKKEIPKKQNVNSIKNYFCKKS